MYPDGEGTFLKDSSPVTPLPLADVQCGVQWDGVGQGSPTPEVIRAQSACTGESLQSEADGSYVNPPVQWCVVFPMTVQV